MDPQGNIYSQFLFLFTSFNSYEDMVTKFSFTNMRSPLDLYLQSSWPETAGCTDKQ